MPLIITGLNSITGLSGLSAQTNTGGVAFGKQLELLCNDWAKTAFEIYAIRGKYSDFRRLFSVSPVLVNSSGAMTAFLTIKKETTPLATFQWVSVSNVSGGSVRVLGKRTLKTTISSRKTPRVQGRALRTSPFKNLKDKRTGTPAFWYAGKGSLFARNQQATWSGGVRLPIHRLLTIPLGSYANSDRVRLKLGLPARIAALNATIRRIT